MNFWGQLQYLLVKLCYPLLYHLTVSGTADTWFARTTSFVLRACCHMELKEMMCCFWALFIARVYGGGHNIRVIHLFPFETVVEVKQTHVCSAKLLGFFPLCFWGSVILFGGGELSLGFFFPFSVSVIYFNVNHEFIAKFLEAMVWQLI